MIINLAVNARDAMPGGGRLAIETENCDLSAETNTRHPDVPAGQYVLLTMSDTGCGMEMTGEPMDLLRRTAATTGAATAARACTSTSPAPTP